MKNFIKTLAWRLLLRFNQILSAETKGNKTLIIPPTSAGSIGDEAVLHGLIEACGFINSDATVLCWKKGDYHQLPIPTLNGELFFHGSSFKYFWHAKNLIHGFERVIIAGTDMMDGFYDDWIPNKLIDIGEIALSSGAKAVVFGFSIANHSKPTIQRLASSQIDTIVRDPVSLRRLQQIPHHNNRATLGADCSIWCEPSDRKHIRETYLEKIAGPFIVLNLSPPSLEESSDAEMSIDEICKAICEWCHKESVEVLILPHHFQRRKNDLPPCQRAYEILQKNNIPTIFIQEQLRPFETKFIVSQSLMIVTGRMHLALAACSTSVPSICFPYMNKFEGMFELYELPNENLITLTSKSQISSRVLERLIHTKTNLAVIKKRLTRRNQRIKDLTIKEFLV